MAANETNKKSWYNVHVRNQLSSNLPRDRPLMVKCTFFTDRRFLSFLCHFYLVSLYTIWIYFYGLCEFSFLRSHLKERIAMDEIGIVYEILILLTSMRNLILRNFPFRVFFSLHRPMRKNYDKEWGRGAFMGILSAHTLLCVLSVEMSMTLSTISVTKVKVGSSEVMWEVSIESIDKVWFPNRFPAWQIRMNSA